MDTTDSPNANEGHKVGGEITKVDSNLQTKALEPATELAAGKVEVDEEESPTGNRLQPDIIGSAALVTTQEAPPNRDKKLTSNTKVKSEIIESSRGLKRKNQFPPFWALHPYGFNKWHLCARVEQKFNIVHYSSKKRMKLLLVDAEGSKIEASMYDGEVDRLENLVEEGKVYTFRGVDVRNASSQFKLVKSDVQCLFTKETEIEEQEDDNSIPMYSFKFVAFDRLHAFEGNKHLLIDVMAMVREVGPIYYKYQHDKQIPKRDVLLVDKTLQHVRLVVSDQLAMLDSDWQSALCNDAIIVVTALLVYSSKDFLLLYASYNSRVFFNPPIGDIQNIKISILEQLQSKEIISCNMVAINLSGATRIAVRDLKEISDFNNNKCGIYEVVVKITRVYYEEHKSLWYTGCVRCKKSLLEAPSTQYWCSKCEKFYSDGSLRYVFNVKIADHSGSHDVTIFNDVGETLLGIKADVLAHKENSHVAILEKIQSLLFTQYNLFLMVGSKYGNQFSRPMHEISVVHCTPTDPIKEANYLLGVINSST